uniref:Uncharacterized protein n=1 Tax=Naja naja TaxID=35670 RepID=A0A8C6YGG4_NAJNA
RRSSSAARTSTATRRAGPSCRICPGLGRRRRRRRKAAPAAAAAAGEEEEEEEPPPTRGSARRPAQWTPSQGSSPEPFPDPNAPILDAFPPPVKVRGDIWKRRTLEATRRRAQRLLQVDLAPVVRLPFDFFFLSFLPSFPSSLLSFFPSLPPFFLSFLPSLPFLPPSFPSSFFLSFLPSLPSLFSFFLSVLLAFLSFCLVCLSAFPTGLPHFSKKHR